MDRWMDVWINQTIYESMNRWIEGLINRWIDRWIDQSINGLIDGSMYQLIGSPEEGRDIQRECVSKIESEEHFSRYQAVPLILQMVRNVNVT